MKPQPVPRRIDLWVPQLLATGGIQHYSRTFLRALTELLPGAEIRVLSKTNSRTAWTGSARTPARSRETRPSWFGAASFGSLLVEQTLRHPPDLAILTHLHFAPAARTLRAVMGLRYWVAAHGVEAWGKKSALLRGALAGAEKILPVSTYTTRRLLETTRLDVARFHLLPNAVDGELFYPGDKPAHLLHRYKLEKKHRILFSLARLDAGERYKGCDLVLDALPKLLETIPEVHYLLAGDGDDAARLRARIGQLGLERYVTLTGFLPEREVREHYQLCDAFVMPSRGEGFGVVFLEALACGRPVVAGNEDGSGEALLGGELGTLVNPHDPPALADTLVWILRGKSPPHPPDELRRRVIEEFGVAAFRKRLGTLLGL
jgi:glycosyltransferase involved in cell wall biosynthesis